MTGESSHLAGTTHCTPLGRANLPALLNRLKAVLSQRFVHDSSAENNDEYSSNVAGPTHCPFEYMRHRLNPLKAWTVLSEGLKRESTGIVPPYDAATCFGALTSRLGETAEDAREHELDVCQFSFEAAAFACAFDKPELALQWAEQGRTLLWSQLNNLRKPFDDIRVLNSHRQKYGTRTPSDSVSVSESSSLGDEAHSHISLAQQWANLLETVRQVPGFEPFLHPKSCSDLFSNLPESGPVVLINVDATRCDAIALLAGRDRPIHIPLPNFSLKKANQYRSDLLQKLRLQGLRASQTETHSWDRAVHVYRSGRKPGDGVVFQILHSLWIEIVKPILDALEFKRLPPSHGNLPPRIWWCPTGTVSYLPIHAAGVYCGLHRESILDYVTSSYTPTISALTDRVRNSKRTGEGVSGLFLTSQPNAPGTTPLPGTTDEVRSICARAADAKARVLMLEGSDLTVEKCLQHMEDYSCIHLACHASQDASEPLHSRFIFHNGDLDLCSIIQQDLKNADLAFLSACQTSVGGEKVSDEAVHLASGMLAAGYRRVVGTMWAIGDQHAPEVSYDFYEYLWGHGEEGFKGKIDGSRSAYALHHSIQQLRLRLDESEKSLLTWIPYAHFGY